MSMPRWQWAGIAVLLAGCAAGPEYVVPDARVPAGYKYAAAPRPDPSGRWKIGQPADEALRGEWWRIFREPTLDAYQDEALRNSPTLQGAAARLKQARALYDAARAGRLPRLAAGFGLSRERPSPASEDLAPDATTETSTLWRAELGASYDADLFGRVAATVAGAKADTERGAALYRSALLMLQADIAQTYFLVRELDSEKRVYDRALALRLEIARLIQDRHDAGQASELDLMRARTELETARADAYQAARRRAVAENALALLLGRPPADFFAPFEPLERVKVVIPAGLPAALLERRPDIAAAECAMAAANARIGEAEAAFFPSLELTAAGGFESGELGDLFAWSSRTFLLGPLVGTALTLPIFDGGRRQARLSHAQARYEEDVAAYRQTVLNAFREVEDGLAHLRIMQDQMRAQDAATETAERAAGLARLQYQAGAFSQLDVIDADRTLLEHQLAAARLAGEQARTVVQLVRALGGGWGLPVPAEES